jgi:hypothetical protein
VDAEFDQLSKHLSGVSSRSLASASGVTLPADVGFRRHRFDAACVAMNS